MSALLKFRFRWFAYGADHQLVIEAPSYPEACYALGGKMAVLYQVGVPKDFEMDLSKQERVE